MSVGSSISLLTRGLVLYSFLFVPKGVNIYTGFLLYDLALVGNITHFLYFLEQVLGGVFKNNLLNTFICIFCSNLITLLYIYNFLIFTDHSTLTIKWLVAVTSLSLGSLILDLTHIINKWSDLYFKMKDVKIKDTNLYYSSSDEDDEEDYINEKKNN